MLSDERKDEIMDIVEEKYNNSFDHAILWDVAYDVLKNVKFNSYEEAMYAGGCLTSIYNSYKESDKPINRIKYWFREVFKKGDDK